MVNPFEELKDEFEKKFGNELSIEFILEKGSLGIVIRVVGHSSSFFSATVTGDAAYRDDIQVDVKREGWGTKLVLAMDFVFKKLSVKTSFGHVTHRAVLKILESVYGVEKLTFFKRGWNGPGAQISYEEVRQIPEEQGYYVLVAL